jgi:hypothetical protein
MELAVFGPGFYKGAKYENYGHVANVLDNFRENHEVSKMHTGGGGGVETLALRYAAVNGIEADVTPPNIKKDGDNAFNVRNNEIIHKADFVLLLWDTSDKKYERLIKNCVNIGKRILICGVE